MSDIIGPTFGDELLEAGLVQLPIAWNRDGAICGREGLTPEQNDSLDRVLASHDPMKPARRLVPKSVIVARLQAAGKLAAARAALDADLYARERWYAPDRPSIYADDPEALALLASIGADPAVILAPS